MKVEECLKEYQHDGTADHQDINVQHQDYREKVEELLVGEES